MTHESLGALTARSLRGAWRAAPPPTTLSPADLERITPHLLATGTGALGWWAVRADTHLARTPAAQHLADAHRLHRLHAGLHDRRLATVLDLCAGLGIDPLLLKGWTIARRYPERGLRPYGDVDLLVRPDERERLQRALDARAPGDDRVEVDLEHAFILTDGEDVDALNARSRRIPFGERTVRALSSEDELRLVCVHYLRAGGWRSLSLCDVALLLEQRPAELDWAAVLPDDRRRGWVRVAAGLAAGLLGAELRATPLEGAEATVPGWVRQHVERGFADSPTDRLPAPRFQMTVHPGRLGRQLVARWPDVLELTLHHRRRIRRRTPNYLIAADLGRRAGAYAIPAAITRGR